MGGLACPSCSGDLGTPIQVRTLAICPNCLRTVAMADGSCRLAVADDTLALVPTELTNLRDLRKAARKGQTA